MHQINRIIEVMGTPSPEDIAALDHPPAQEVFLLHETSQKSAYNIIIVCVVIGIQGTSTNEPDLPQCHQSTKYDLIVLLISFLLMFVY